MPTTQPIHAFSAGGIIYRHLPTLPTYGSTTGAEPPPSLPLSAPAAQEHTALPLSPLSPTRGAKGEISGEVLALISSTVEVVLVGNAATDFWVLPKGTPKPGETTEQVALREVAEESGIRGRIVGKLGSIHYSFARNGIRFRKEVLYYLMEAIRGDVSLHDHEYEDARWFTLADATKRLVYTNEVGMLEKAVLRLGKRITPKKSAARKLTTSKR